MKNILAPILLFSSISAACTPLATLPLPCEGSRSSWPFSPHAMHRISDPAAEGQSHIIIGIPFGYWNDDWQALLASMKASDELWHYTATRWRPSPGGSDLKYEQEGYVVLRGCTVVSQFVTVDMD